MHDIKSVMINKKDIEHTHSSPNSTVHISRGYVSRIYYNQDNTCRHLKQGNNRELPPDRLGAVVFMEKTHKACDKHFPGVLNLSHDFCTWEDLICMGRHWDT